MAGLTSMMNIGKEMEKKLASVGIGSPVELMEAGAKNALLRLKQKYPNVCLVHLYALEGAIDNVAYNSLPEDKKKELKEFSDFLKNSGNAGSRLQHYCRNDGAGTAILKSGRTGKNERKEGSVWS